MSNIVKLNINNQSQEMAIKDYKGQRVVSFKDIDELHQRSEGTSKRNYSENKRHFIEGVDYFLITPAQKNEFRTLEIPNRGLIVLTESGYLMLVKSFTDDLAWEVQRQLVNNYFRSKVAGTINPLKQAEIEARLRNSKARQASVLLKIANNFKDILSPTSLKLLAGNAAEVVTGQPLLPKPQTEVHFTATEIAEEAGVSANKVGRVAKKYNIKTPENGMWILDKSASSIKQVNTFVYNTTGREKLLDLIKKEMRLSQVK